jgi:hypothetical protein
VVKAVRKGDIPLLEKLLEKKNADMGMTWVSVLLTSTIKLLKHTLVVVEKLVISGLDIPPTPRNVFCWM